MLSSIPRTLAVAGAQVRICRSLVRFWVAIVLLTVFVLIGYIQSCVWHTLNAPYSPSFSLAEPKYLLSNIDALVFLAFQFVAVLLTFDVRQFHNRNRIQSALESRQLTNFEYLLGSVLGVSFLLYLVVLCNILIIELLGVLSYFVNSSWGDFLEPASVFNLLIVDAFPSLFLWSSVAIALSTIFRSGIVAVLISASLLMTFYTSSLLVPFSWLDVVTPSSNFTAYISELVPNFAALEVIGLRLLTVVGALGLLAFAAGALNRRDARIGLLNLPIGFGVLALSIAGFTFLALQLIEANYKPQEWSKIHASYDQNVELDVDEINGSVEINPGQQLALDLTYVFRVKHKHETPYLTFTLNPGLTIDRLTLNGKVVEHEFSNGLLIVPTSLPILPDEIQEFSIKAHGVPDPRFAYLDSPTDYINDRSIPRRVAQLFGKDGSIFTDEYVALMPGMYWYPNPGPQNYTRSFTSGIDYFRTDIDLSISNPHWLLVSTDVTQQLNDKGKFKLQPSNPISEIAVFGTKFVKHSMTISGIKFNLYLHEDHLKNIGKFNLADEKVQEIIDDIVVPFEEADLGYPFEELSFVEIPNRLRTLGGGFKTETVQVLPGMLLMKERGFPHARFDTRIKRIERWEDDTEYLEYHKYWALSDYFEDAIGTDNLWASFAKMYWTHATAATGENAVVINELALNLVSRLSRAPNLWFSPYSTYQTADMTQTFLRGTQWSLAEGSGRDTSNWVRSISQRYLNRHSIWESMETKSLLELPSGDSHQSDLEFMIAKLRALSQVLLRANGREKTFEWLSTLREKFRGTNFTIEDLLEVAESVEIEIHPYLTEWLSGKKLPGYITSDLTHRRLSDDEEDNPRYETSFFVYNPKEIPGVFWAAYPPPPRVDIDWPRTPIISVDGLSTVRVNVVTSYEIDYVHVWPNLSLNRNEFGVRRAVNGHWALNEPNGEPRPTFEEADWQPTSHGIVVDDLDAGFAAHQPTNFASPPTVGPIGWFSIPTLEADTDRGLPARTDYVYRTKSGVWGRMTHQSSYGTFRRTATLTRYAPEIYEVAFNTELPDTTRWKLEYYVNTEYFRRRSRVGDYHLVIDHPEGTETRDFNFKESIFGWNYVDEFELLEGDISVKVVGASNNTIWLYADAIRWVPVSADREFRFGDGGGGGS